MSIKLEAPFGSTAQITFLPNPDLADEEAMDMTTFVRKAMDNTLYSYNKRPGSTERKLTFNWQAVARAKIIEIIEFLELYAGGFIRLTDHRDRNWKVAIENNPVDFSITKRANPITESGSFQLVFVGKPV